jgi:hypothetical protein
MGKNLKCKWPKTIFVGARKSVSSRHFNKKLKICVQSMRVPESLTTASFNVPGPAIMLVWAAMPTKLWMVACDLESQFDSYGTL